METIDEGLIADAETEKHPRQAVRSSPMAVDGCSDLRLGHHGVQALDHDIHTQSGLDGYGQGRKAVLPLSGWGDPPPSQPALSLT